MPSRVALVTGACGEMGHALIPALRQRGYEVVVLDLAPLETSLRDACLEAAQASVLDAEFLRDLFRRHRPELVFHLAAVLSTKAEREPDVAYDVNVSGTVGLLRLCREEASTSGRSVRFLFPSSIAVYGLPDRASKDRAGAVREDEFDRPAALYGINKLQCEMLGSYFAARAAREGMPGIDFRAIRFPGLISAETLPTGGTTDYAPEMMHAAAQDKPYSCFVDEDTQLPFMTMGDAVEAFVRLAETSAHSLSRRVYNVKSFGASASEIRAAVVGFFPDAKISFEPVPARQAIVDSWPADVDDSLARRDWGFSPRFGLTDSLRVEFVPALQRRYATRVRP